MPPSKKRLCEKVASSKSPDEEMKLLKRLGASLSKNKRILTITPVSVPIHTVGHRLVRRKTTCVSASKIRLMERPVTTGEQES